MINTLQDHTPHTWHNYQIAGCQTAQQTTQQ